MILMGTSAVLAALVKHRIANPKSPSGEQRFESFTLRLIKRLYKEHY